MPALGVFWRADGDSYTFASATGENLQSITFTDLQGRVFRSVTTARPNITIEAGEIPADIFIATVTMAKGKWTFKIKR